MGLLEFFTREGTFALPVFCVPSRVERRGPGAENKTVTGTTFMRFRGPLGPNRTCSTAWRCKSYSQRDGREVIAKRNGEITLAARRGRKEARSKDASR
jgi:hypothetical protein